MAFDPLVTNPGRLQILTALAAEQGQEFVRLRHRTGLTDGNLASHAKRLQSAGLIDVEKHFRDGKPVTSYLLTHSGRSALQEHLRAVSAAINPISHPDHMAAVVPVALPRGVTSASPDDDDWID